MKKVNFINLSDSNLTKLTESDLIQFCELNRIEISELEYLNLNNNKLSNIDFITFNNPFVNLKHLLIADNKNLNNITNIKYLPNLEYLDISYLTLDNEYETIELLKTIKELYYLDCYETFNNYTLIQVKEELPDIKINY